MKDCELDRARKIILEDPNGSELTSENYQEVLRIVDCEIRELRKAVHLPVISEVIDRHVG